jgi:aminoglycoside 6-adenylyltransferase
MILEWEIGIRTGWSKTLGFKGKYLQSHLVLDVWNEYKQTYVDADYDNLWESLFLFHKIFKRSAEFVAANCGFLFPHDKATKVLTFLEYVRKLPSNTQTIYSGDDGDHFEPSVSADR